MYLREAVRYRVLGRVQGVGFRWFVRESARALELSGWVRNEPDGSVLLEVAGARAALDQLEQLLRAGPPGSAVVALQAEPMEQFVWDLPTPFAVHR